jgi:pimeloyl-ACP methyl ester carboxylesterase
MGDHSYDLWRLDSRAMSRRLPRSVFFLAAVVAAAVQSADPAAAQTALVPAQDAAGLLGSERAQGAVIWSHGRSLQKECSLAPTPDYIGVFRAAGWDTFRLNRPRSADTQAASGAALADAAEALKHRGYRRVVLAGQSFGAFISLIAAGRSDAVDAVIGTAPAAYGSAQSNPSGFAQNATGLYDLLGTVRRARIALFFFEGDVFDPGGRGPMADQILAAHGLTRLVVDRPAGLPTHWAAAGPAFATQYASCLVAFAAGNLRASTPDCRTQAASAQTPGLERSSPSAPSRVRSALDRNSTSVIDLQIGRRVDVNRTLGGR